MAFKIFWIIDAIASLVILYFFLIGLADGTVSQRNAGLWTVIVLSLVIIMGGSAWFKANSHTIPAYALLLLLLLPALFFVGYFLIVALGGGRMN